MSKPKFMLFSPQQMQEYVNNSQSFEEILQKMQYNHPNDRRIIQSIRNYCNSLNIECSHLPDIIETDTLKCPCCNQVKEKSNFYFSGGKLAQKPCKACVREREKQKYKNHKQELNNYKIEHTCAKCGCDKFYVIDFHHIDPSIKDFTIASNPRKNMKTLMKELEKCIPLCSNCHREFHYLEREKNISIQEYLEAYPSGDGDSLLNCQAE